MPYFYIWSQDTNDSAKCTVWGYFQPQLDTKTNAFSISKARVFAQGYLKKFSYLVELEARSGNPFDYVCAELLNDNVESKYDYVLIDYNIDDIKKNAELFNIEMNIDIVLGAYFFLFNLKMEYINNLVDSLKNNKQKVKEKMN